MQLQEWFKEQHAQAIAPVVPDIVPTFGTGRTKPWYYAYRGLVDMLIDMMVASI